jgi:hypothetical protein
MAFGREARVGLTGNFLEKTRFFSAARLGFFLADCEDWSGWRICCQGARPDPEFFEVVLLSLSKLAQVS